MTDNSAVQEVRAGRELDALVAEKVMGFRHCLVIPLGPHATPTLMGSPPNATGRNKVPEYSGDIAAAWLVVEKMRERFDTVIVESCLDGFSVRLGDYEAPAPLVHVSIDPRQGGVALAICLASLKAVSPRPPSA